MALYEKPVRLLFKDMVKEFSITQDDVIKRDNVYIWFRDNYPKVKDATISAHLLRMSVNAPSRIHYGVNPNGEDDLLYQIDSQRFRLYNPTADLAPIYQEASEEGAIIEQNLDGEPTEVREFAYERDLQNFLSKNLSVIETGLRLYEEEGIKGVEFPVGSRYIDILALDKDNNYVVIELKVSRGYDRVVGQILRYIAWIKKNHADEGQNVRGIIIARQISDDLLLACSEITNLDLYEYELSISLNKVNL